MSKNTSILCLLIGLIIVISIVFLTWTILAFTSYESQSSRSNRMKESSSSLDSVIVVLPSEGYDESLATATTTTSTSYPKNDKDSPPALALRDLVIPYKLPPNSENSSPEFLDNTINTSTGWFNNNKPNRFSGPPSIKHYDSGHFRSTTAPIWDPHPEYKFNVFGKNFHLVLGPADDFLSPNFRVTTHESNFTWRETNGGDSGGGIGRNKCFYRGYVVGDMENSAVAVSLCHGMTGHIRTSWGSYFIEPAETWKGPNHPLLHEIYSIPPIQFVNHEDSESMDHHHDSIKFFSSENQTENLPHPHLRRKRSMSKERYVELMVVADSTMSAYHGDNLRHYVLTLLSIVALVYKDASIGNPVNIALVKFHVLRDKDFRWRGITSHNELYRRSANSGESGQAYGISAAEMLRNFCKWQKEENTIDDNSIYHHDTALLLTRETICRNPYQQKCDTLGLAELGTMCDHYASCAIVQDNGLSAAFTIAHELGHVLNMPHDDDTKCQSFISGSAEKTNKPIQSHYVMSRMLDHNTYPWAWSKCSRHYLTEFLDAGHGSCLEDTPQSNMLDTEETISNPTGSRIPRHGRPQPGEIFSENRQCQLVFGPQSQLCSYMPVCRRLWCTTGESGSEEEGCRTQHMPWADGTPCSIDKWCQRGQCVLRDLEKLREVNGGWGQWQAFGQCSRPCGGGVRRSIRECDNPLPSNGGKYCIGPRVQYESCNTHECSGEHKDFRAEQCAAFNLDNFNIQGLPKDVQWAPKYTGISLKDRCKLFCRVIGSSAYYLLKEKVVDGTLCGPDTFDICVNGKCLPAGCDRRLHSDKVLDRCGICGGNNVTCRTQSGSYNESKYGYSEVFTIPAGASSIDVRQRGFNNSARDDNYLAILDPSNQDYILNGHFIVSMFRKIVHVAGTSIEYSGSDSIVERINSSTKPLKSDLLIQVLSVGKLHAPDIHYQYTISLNQEAKNSPNYESFEWKASDRWMKCTQLCFGTRYREVICVEKNRNQEVERRYCGEEPPLPSLVPCNEDCHLVWKVVDSSPCSVTCGSGKKNLIIRCVQLFSNGTYSQVSDSMCDPVTRPEDTESCKETCNIPNWRYSAWSSCSVRCGADGKMTRSVECVDSFGSQVNSKYCVQMGDPITTKNCGNNGPCGEWRIDQWSPCSATCGDGVTRALYACYQNHHGGAILPPDFCYKDPQPISERPCSMPPCVKWEVDEWTGCSSSCGPGQMTRRVFCVDENIRQTTRNDTLCELNNLLKPDNRKDCNLGHCATRFDSREKYAHVMDNSLDSPQTSALIQSLNSAGQYGWKIDPWTECFNDYNRNKRIRERRVTCISMSRLHPPVDDYYCSVPKPAYYEECEESFPSSFFWWTGEWDESTCRPPSCVDRRLVRCLSDPGSQPAPDSKCHREVPSKMRPCSKNGCTNTGTALPFGSSRSGRINRGFGSNSTWRLGPWGKCSQLCGGGTKLRQVVCQYENGSLSYSCDNIERPPYSTSCNPDPCPVWHLGSWRDCTAECGGGIKERRVVCRDLHGVNLPDYSCDVRTKPNTSEACNEEPCETNETNEISGIEFNKIRYRWDLGNWTECSKKCGKGMKKRKVQCIKVSNTKLYPTEPVGDTFCSHIPKPKDENSCKRFPCPHQWVTSQWSECSIPCGYGIQQRTVTCHKVNRFGWIDPDPLPSACENIEKPKEYHYCFDSECNSQFGWKKEPWSPCPERCGKATKQKRRVFCARKSNGQRVGGHFCPKSHKPERRRKCPIKPCTPTTCMELRSTTGKHIDGNYTLFIGGKNITIYCKDMDVSSTPKEYINLPDDNYSEVYSKRLIRPETCPRGGERLDTCECIEDSNRRSGYTIFHKIRVNVTNLRVDAEDFSFITQVTGRTEIGYGQSGDCYSSANCPQGRFSINLQGTGLAVSPSTLWISNGHKASIWINRSQDNLRISAKCGGYCGNCAPSQFPGLKLGVT